MAWTRAARNDLATYLDTQAALSTEAATDATEHGADNLARYHADQAAERRTEAAAVRDGVHPSELGYRP